MRSAWNAGNTKLWLDDKLVVDNAVNQNTSAPPKTVEMPLQKGHAYRLRIEQTASRGAPVRLVWRHVDRKPDG